MLTMAAEGLRMHVRGLRFGGVEEASGNTLELRGRISNPLWIPEENTP